ncbi:SMC-Scp complex subunit ScpB [Idiomarina xiamenensis]|uniref:Transcriptional regulator n=1 Tax=Idiomarina xiamenensis 10-D-4 TaxID=740709 RepID=K2KPG2_9GAMM|nr:SMC-Scp complex subunit ScpB [Idiomarina xiamenensis]EKE84304.1 transcriptional regulator [Idiomarina xiamenensis 10-D-4]
MKLNDQQLLQVIEAALFVAEQPMTAVQLQEQLLAAYSVSNARIKKALAELQQHYQNRGVELVQVASGYRFQSKPEFAALLANLWQEKPPRYSQALLETLALIAYRQPITRGEIEDVRGVSVSSQIMKTLQERGWIKVVGHREVPGRPQLYATTKTFLDDFNIKDLSELPAIAEPASATTAETATNDRVH